MSKELKVDRDRMMEAANSCPQAKEVLKKIWPEEFRGRVAKLGDVYKRNCTGVHFIIADVGIKHYALIQLDGLYLGIRWDDKNYYDKEVPEEFTYVGRAEDLITIKEG